MSRSLDTVKLATAVAAVALSIPIGSSVRPAFAQTCWAYVDTEEARTPLECVQKANPGASCSWPSDCTSVPASTPQRVLAMHTRWHNCFGNVGGASPPSGRSQRWYAFHRQFELDFNQWRQGVGLSPIESLEWCPNMNLPVAHHGAGLAPNTHPAGCGTGTGRPANVACDLCVAFPRCLFLPGAGPAGCPTAPSATCGAPGGPTQPFTSLDQFPNVDEVAKVLDAHFHGQMHTAIGVGDRSGPTCNPPGTLGGCYNLDALDPSCSPRDPLFWRLHKALDDVVRAFQDSKAVDVMLVIDRSGSMSEPDSGGGTKLSAALAASDYFADLLEDGRSDGQRNRIGIVTYSDAANLALSLTEANASLRNPGGPFATALASVAAAGPGGCTSIGSGIQVALTELCPPAGDCRNLSLSGDNDRKAILLLSDGMENKPPCLQPEGGSGIGCGSQCFGAPLDYDRLEFTQLVAVGFGNSGSLNGDLLTLIAERQGGVYMQNPNGPADDLKDFFAKAFGDLSSEFLMLDPQGLLAATDAASEPVQHTTCGDAVLTFASGWQTPVDRGELRLLVNTPAGHLLRATDSGVEASTERLWAFARSPVAAGTAAPPGTWRAQLVRPHQVFVNGFPPDSYALPDQGLTVTRRQLQRLCPDGCRRALYFEQGRVGPRSAFEEALEAERAAGLIEVVKRVDNPSDFASVLGETWDVIVYAHAGPDRPEPYDGQLAELLCGRQRALIADLRIDAGARLLRCAGVTGARGSYAMIRGDGRLFEEEIKLTSHGRTPASIALAGSNTVMATADAGRSSAIVARVRQGNDNRWFVNVLGRGLAKISPHNRRLVWQTGDEILASARILPSYLRAGGYDNVDARVEVTSPTVGLGTLIARQGRREPREVAGELLDARAAALVGLTVPTTTSVFPLFDDGTHGDIHAGNAVWTGPLTGLGKVDGTYKLRFIFDLTAEGCTTRRELLQSVFVEPRTDPGASLVRVQDRGLLADGRRRTEVVLRPIDGFGNLWGSGRTGPLVCAPEGTCEVEHRSPRDDGKGTYEFNLLTAPGTAGGRVTGFGTTFDVAVQCEDCPRLAKVTLEPAAVTEHQPTRGRVVLDAAPKKSAVVFLATNTPTVATVPATVNVAPGETAAEFPVTVLHVHDAPVSVEISAAWRGARQTAILTVSPAEPGKDVGPPKPRELMIHYPGGKHAHGGKD